MTEAQRQRIQHERERMNLRVWQFSPSEIDDGPNPYVPGTAGLRRGSRRRRGVPNCGRASRVTLTATMRDRTVELLLAACQECGALQLRDLYAEVALLAAGKEFTSAEVCAHAALPENHRLRAAIAAVYGDDFGAGKVGKLFAQYAGVDIAGTVITRIGEDANAILWPCQSQPEQAPRAESDTIGALPIALGKRYAR